MMPDDHTRQFYDKRRKENILDGLSPDARISRVFRWRWLKTMLSDRSLTLSRFSTWEDPFEAFVYSARQRMEDGTLVTFSQNAYGQCWAVEYESDALWRIYSHYDPKGVTDELGVRVSTTVSKLFNAVYGEGPSTCLKLYIGRVKYLDSSQMLALQSNIPKIWKNTVMDTTGRTHALLLFNKRDAFEHEREVRLIYNASSDDDFLNEDHKGFPIDPHEVFDSVLLDPRCSDACKIGGSSRARGQAVEIEKELRRLGFTGKIEQSGLYDPPPPLEFPFDL